MLFNSLEFLFLFLPAVWLVFALTARLLPHRFALGWLAGASLFFYGWWNPVYLPLLIFSVCSNFLAGLWIDRTVDDRRRFGLTALFVAANLLLLGYYKYTNFFVDQVNGAFGAGIEIGAIVLPLAISFHTFQQIAYLVDIRRRQHGERDFLRYLLFVVFFPQLIAGPIVHHKELLPQLEALLQRKFRLEYRHVAVGLSVFIIGLCKKVLIADYAATFSSPVFEAAERGQIFGFLDAWGGALAYTFQIYFDFSGYSDMAVGLGFLFGLRLPFNFAAPYAALSIIDFWRRWHMTLSRFLRDYLYIPLGGGHCSPARRNLNLMLTMLLGGLWHGAGWTFVIWGLLHGLFLSVNHLWRTALGKKTLTRLDDSRLYAASSWILTFLCVVIAWVFFRAASLDGALHMLAAMFGVGGLMLPESYFAHSGFLGSWLGQLGVRFEGTPAFFAGKTQYALLAGLTAAVLLLPRVRDLFAKDAPGLDPYPPPPARSTAFLTWRPNLSWALLLALAFAASVYFLRRDSEFLYFQF